jgi:formylglycine-generating enzyme
MHGNVWEWCSDIYGEDYYKQTPSIDPKGPQEGKDKVMRGGAWKEYAYKCRSADRNDRSPKANQPIIGFRVVLDIEKSEAK